MDYCDYCDGNIKIQNIRGKIVGICLDCGKSTDSSPEYQEKEDIKQQIRVAEMKGRNMLRCDYCYFEVLRDRQTAARMENHKLEEHEEEYLIEQADEDELVEMTANSVYKLAKMALDRIEDQKELAKVFHVSDDWQLRVEAVKKLKKLDILEDVWVSDPNIKVRQAARKRLDSLQ